MTSPMIFAECMVSDEWKEHWKATCAELDQWKKLGVTESTRREDTDPNAPIIKLRDLHDKKYNPDGTFHKFKMRQVAGGHMLRKDTDYTDSYAPTVAAIIVRLFFAIMAVFGVLVESMDVSTAYLYAVQEILIYAYEPIYYHYYDHPEELPALREKLLRMSRTERRQWLRQMKKGNKKCLRLLRSVYGIPSAG